MSPPWDYVYQRDHLKHAVPSVAAPPHARVIMAKFIPEKPASQPKTDEELDAEGA